MLPSELSALARSVFTVGFDGASVEDAPLAELRAFGPGGVILFARNVAAKAADLERLVGALRALDPLPPLVAVDQEGGRVARIGDPVVALPPALALGAGRDPGRTERLATALGRDLARLGISVDFAPVADLQLEREDVAIGNRSFGADPEAVAAQVVAFARGLERGGVAATLKHFPGHGATPVDSHVDLPRVDAAAATLRSRDLVPFARAIAERAASLVMAGHLVVPALDPDRPASCSPRILGGLLRDELGFGGVAVTDCLEMGAVSAGAGTVAAATAALAAGADLLLVSRTLALAERAADEIAAAVDGGAIPLARLEEAAARVRALRTRCATLVPYGGPLDPSDAIAAARAAVTRVHGDVRLRAGLPVSVISFEGAAFDGAAGGVPAASLSAALRARRVKSELMRVALEPAAADVDLLLEHLPALGLREFVLVVRRADLRPAQRAAVARILAAVPHAVVVSAREPYDALLWPEARGAAAIYGDGEPSFAAAADVLTGAAAAGG